MKYLVKNKYWEINKEYNCDKLLYLLIDQPDYITEENNFIWTNKTEKFHRDYDLPSFSGNSGYITWWKKYLRHRENDKPAVIRTDGVKEYYINGKEQNLLF